MSIHQCINVSPIHMLTNKQDEKVHVQEFYKADSIEVWWDTKIKILQNGNQNGKFLLKENQSNRVKDPTSSLISKYKEFCQSFFLTEIIKEPTRTTCNTASLLDHILTNCAEKVSQKRIIDVGLSDHQLIFCTRKIRRTRRNMHNQIQTRSLRNYSAEKLISTLKDIKFPNYDIFSDVNVAYADLTKKISDAIDNVAPIKTLRINNNSQDWFDSEIAEAIKLREKYF